MEKPNSEHIEKKKSQIGKIEIITDESPNSSTNPITNPLNLS